MPPRLKARSAADLPADPVPADDASAPLGYGSLDHLVGYLSALASADGRKVFQQHVGEPFELRLLEFSLLMLLLGNERAAPKQLAQSLNVPAPQITMLVDRLEQRALLTRRPSPHDGRALLIELTEAGRSLADRAYRVSRTMERDWLSPLSAAEQAMLRELLQKLTGLPHG